MAGRIQVKIVFFPFIISLLILLVNCSSPIKSTDKKLYNTDLLKSGDIILRKSFGLISEMVVAQLHDTLDVSHCGIIYKDSTNNFKVIHCLSKIISDVDGVQICSLEHFMEESKIETVHIFRFRSDTNALIISKAKYYLKKETPFDEKFRAGDNSAFFCSEFPISIILSEFGIDISAGSPKPKFSIFLNNMYFDEINFIKKKKTESDDSNQAFLVSIFQQRHKTHSSPPLNKPTTTPINNKKNILLNTEDYFLSESRIVILSMFFFIK